MTIIHFLPNPLLIIDPLNISIEYLFRASQTGIIYTGDPDFEDDVKQFSHKFDSIIIRHFAFDADVYKRTYERAMRQVRSANVIDTTRQGESLTSPFIQELDSIRIYHVASHVSEEVAAQVGSLHVLRFDLFGADLDSYIYQHLKRTLHPPSVAAAAVAAAEGDDAASGGRDSRAKSRFEKVQRELDLYLNGRHSLSSADTTQIRHDSLTWIPSHLYPVL